MTLDLDALAKLCEAATPEPWKLNIVGIEELRVVAGAGPNHRFLPKTGPFEAGKLAESDAAFIAAARTALPALIARLKAAEAVCMAVDYRGAQGAWLHEMVVDALQNWRRACSEADRD